MHIEQAHIQTLHIHLPNQGFTLAEQPILGSINIERGFPAIRAAWPGIDGLYAGITRAEGNEPDGHLVLLNATPGKRMGHREATEWAASLGDGARLAGKLEGALLWANLRDVLQAERWIWLREQYSASYAWSQLFHYGTQYYDVLEAEGGVRAVRRFAL